MKSYFQNLSIKMKIIYAISLVFAIACLVVGILVGGGFLTAADEGPIMQSYDFTINLHGDGCSYEVGASARLTYYDYYGDEQILEFQPDPFDDQDDKNEFVRSVEWMFDADITKMCAIEVFAQNGYIVDEMSDITPDLPFIGRGKIINYNTFDVYVYSKDEHLYDVTVDVKIYGNGELSYEPYKFAEVYADYTEAYGYDNSVYFDCTGSQTISLTRTSYFFVFTPSILYNYEYTESDEIAKFVYDSSGNLSVSFSIWFTYDFSGGTGEEYAPYLISNKNDFLQFANRVNDGEDFADTYFEQTKNIKIGGSIWTPIGNYPRQFSGHYDGGGNKIEGLTTNLTIDYPGLFGFVTKSENATTGAVIKNIILQGGNITYTTDLNSLVSFAGGIVGCVVGEVTIQNCTSNVPITTNRTAGGIVGLVGAGSSDEVKIEKCINKASVTATGTNIAAFAGGIVGSSSSGINCTITNCKNLGDVSCSNNAAGGIIGIVQQESSAIVLMQACESNATITGKYAGGLVGANQVYSAYSSDGVIMAEDCSCSGHIATTDTSNRYAGAFIGNSVTENVVFDYCCFYGTSNIDMNFYSGNAPSCVCCWSWCNDTKLISEAVDSTWNTYWAIVDGINNNMPVLKDVYGVKDSAGSTLAKLQQFFSGAKTYI